MVVCTGGVKLIKHAKERGSPTTERVVSAAAVFSKLPSLESTNLQTGFITDSSLLYRMTFVDKAQTVMSMLSLD